MVQEANRLAQLVESEIRVIDGKTFYTAPCIDGPLEGERITSQSHCYLAMWPRPLESLPGPQLTPLSGLPDPGHSYIDTVTYTLYRRVLASADSLALEYTLEWRCGVKRPDYICPQCRKARWRHRQHWFCDTCQTEDIAASGFNTGWVGWHGTLDDQSFNDPIQRPNENGPDYGTAATMTFELDKTEHCWRDNCGQKSAEESETGLCEKHLVELRSRWDKK